MGVGGQLLQIGGYPLQLEQAALPKVYLLVGYIESGVAQYRRTQLELLQAKEINIYKTSLLIL